MSTYEDEHNITTNEHRRQHETLSNIIDNFLSNTRTIHQTNEQILSTALGQLENNPTIIQMLESLDDKPKKGVDSEFLDTLERVPISELKNEVCPICTNKFIDDPYPLVVRLPCGRGVNHIYDLDCIGPWLQLNSTCPLDRIDLLDLKRQRKDKIQQEIDKAKEEDDEEEEDDWDVYG
ncbi:unnamed protein product [Candida verbasci]|uniref:RING-type domain-containing protein n=1 Tax=Candida verbasci TaxID=1227364 RepID=A0A9W4TWR8_9ASCO|nr:unnamed protein product [Candida verbasci]